MAERLDRLMELVEGEGPEGDLDLAEAALIIAADEYRDLNVSHYLSQLTDIAGEISRRLPVAPAVGDLIFTMNHYLFQELGFVGNESDYYDPRNGYLNEVIDRRRGIPITLSIIYLAVGRSLGLPLEPLSFPGHFLVRYASAEGDRVVLDPYAGGARLFEEDLEALLLDVYGEDVPSEIARQLLTPADKREVVLRVLRNLRNAYLRRETLHKALWATDYLVQIEPEHAGEWRERAQIYEQLEYGPGAAADYRRYLQMAPDASDVDDILKRLESLGNQETVLH